MAACNSGRVAQSACDYMLYAAGGVIERSGLDFGISAKKITALIERHGVRKSAADIGLLDARRRDQIMHNAQVKIALNEYIARQQQIKVLGHRSCQRLPTSAS